MHTHDTGHWSISTILVNDEWVFSKTKAEKNWQKQPGHAFCPDVTYVQIYLSTCLSRSVLEVRHHKLEKQEAFSTGTSTLFLHVWDTINITINLPLLHVFVS